MLDINLLASKSTMFGPLGLRMKMPSVPPEVVTAGMVRPFPKEPHAYQAQPRNEQRAASNLGIMTNLGLATSARDNSTNENPIKATSTRPTSSHTGKSSLALSKPRAQYFLSPTSVVTTEEIKAPDCLRRQRDRNGYFCGQKMRVCASQSDA
jgi:hypothetical protein